MIVWIVYGLVFGFLLAIIAIVCRAQRRQRPNYWPREGRSVAPDPNCQRFPDWRVHSQKKS